MRGYVRGCVVLEGVLGYVLLSYDTKEWEDVCEEVLEGELCEEVLEGVLDQECIS